MFLTLCRNACPVKEEVIAPYWANNTRGELLALLNLYPFEQYVHWEKCTWVLNNLYVTFWTSYFPFFLEIFDSILDMRINKCIVEMDADVSSSTDCIGCWLTIQITSAAAYSATGLNFLAAASAVATTCRLNFEWPRVRHVLRTSDESKCNRQCETVTRNPIILLVDRQHCETTQCVSEGKLLNEVSMWQRARITSPNSM